MKHVAASLQAISWPVLYQKAFNFQKRHTAISAVDFCLVDGRMTSEDTRNMGKLMTNDFNDFIFNVMCVLTLYIYIFTFWNLKLKTLFLCTFKFPTVFLICLLAYLVSF